MATWNPNNEIMMKQADLDAMNAELAELRAKNATTADTSAIARDLDVANMKDIADLTAANAALTEQNAALVAKNAELQAEIDAIKAAMK